MENKTDDQSFKSFLNSLNREDLMEHASNNFFYIVIIDLLMEQEENYNDYLLFLKGSVIGNTPEEIREQVKKALDEAEEETIISTMVEFTPKRKIIEALMDTDEGTRQDIIDNQNNWDEN